MARDNESFLEGQGIAMLAYEQVIALAEKTLSVYLEGSTKAFVVQELRLLATRAKKKIYDANHQLHVPLPPEAAKSRSPLPPVEGARKL